MQLDRRTLLTRGPVGAHRRWTRVAADTWLRVHRIAMACRFEVLLSGEDRRHTAAAHDALGEADRLDAAWSIFRDTSELTAINRGAATAPVPASADTFAILERARTLWRDTGGAFDVTTAPLSRCWGFLARDGRVPGADAIERARALVGMDRVTLDEGARTVRFAAAGVELNLGAIGKGAAVDAIAAMLAARGVRHALVSAAGSSVRAVGGRDGGFAIDLTSPLIERPLARIRLRRGALGTSGAGVQHVLAGGIRYGHVIDPRTGWPAAGVISASVVAPDAATADAVSTAVLIGGRDLAEAWCARHPDTLVVITTEDRRTACVGRSPAAIVEAPCT
jgi:thiamine biosynthesis lipoprotein